MILHGVFQKITVLYLLPSPPRKKTIIFKTVCAGFEVFLVVRLLSNFIYGLLEWSYMGRVDSSWKSPWILFCLLEKNDEENLLEFHNFAPWMIGIVLNCSGWMKYLYTIELLAESDYYNRALARVSLQSVTELIFFIFDKKNHATHVY